MALHPAEIAKEIHLFPFFQSFDESLLLQVSTMVREVTFEKDQVILHPGQMNDTLYFLRGGTVRVMVDNEVVNELSARGEVLGEMSVLSGKPVSAKIQAKTVVSCFSIHADDFAHVHPHQKDRFQFLLYRIYSGILTERLAKTNEKAKMYEITARLLEMAKKELEVVTTAQLGLLRSKFDVTERAVLIVEPNKRQQNIIRSAVGSTGVQLVLVGTVDEAKSAFTQKKFDVIFCDETSLDFVPWVKSQNFKGELVLLQPNTFSHDLIMNSSEIPFIISQDPEDRPGTVRALLTTLTKILNKDFFGLEKYLSWGTEIKIKKVKSSNDREILREEILEHFKSLGVRSSLLARVQVAIEEMLMNAIYDAPVDRAGNPLYNHLPRNIAVDLKENEYADLRFGFDGNMLAISVRDSFGALKRDVISKYFDSCYNPGKNPPPIHDLSTKGGAGRGLHQILESCDYTIFNIKAGEATEVIGLFDIEAANQKKDSRPKFHFFFIP